MHVYYKDYDGGDDDDNIGILLKTDINKIKVPLINAVFTLFTDKWMGYK